MTSFCIQNFGCRVNQAEAFAWSEELQLRGLRLEREAARSDLVVVNTCTLTARADRDVKKFVRQLARKNPSARLVLAGCLVDRARTELETLPNVWRFVPNADKADLPRLLLGEAPRGEDDRRVEPFRSRVPLKIQDGCDFACAYCVIPSVRGRSVSLPPEQALERLRRFTDRGFGEAVLTGIHLCSYGRDLEPRTSLESLLRQAEKASLPLKLRLSSLDPRFLESPLVSALTGIPAVCPHFHVSLQHVSARVLEAMGRRGGAETFSRLLEELRKRSPEAALGADIITGFPGETDSDFEECRRFLEKSPLTYFHVFTYSPRPGTPAAARIPVPAGVGKKRTAELRRISADKTRAFRAGFVGRTVEALVIQRARGTVRLLTGNYLGLRTPDDGRPLGRSARVKITGLEDRGLEGRLSD
ncbi:MAG: MiaB/RimO family radical SAM methylthiotransferase [Candidatus Aminicenantes bacterium]|nr:MiaB/RimO family radical SAM methylthiotransferase [Candidatus Aminicenantes bacterium]